MTPKCGILRYASWRRVEWHLPMSQRVFVQAVPVEYSPRLFGGYYRSEAQLDGHLGSNQEIVGSTPTGPIMVTAERIKNEVEQEVVARNSEVVAKCCKAAWYKRQPRSVAG